MCNRHVARNASVTTPIRSQQEATPVAPKIDAETIRQNVATLARERGDATKVLDTLLNATVDNSYDYHRAKSRDTQAGITRQFNDGRLISDYNSNSAGRPIFDFSATQDVVTHIEQSVQATRGILGRTRHHVVQQQVQTLVSEKVRFDFNISDKLDIRVGQNDTVFLNATLQQGRKDIHLLQQGGGSLAVVLGRDQALRNISFDEVRKTATIVLDNAVLTVHGVKSSNSLVIGREANAQGTAGFVPATSVAATLHSGRQEIFAADKKVVLEMLAKGQETFASAKRVAEDLMARATQERPKQVAPSAAPISNATTAAASQTTESSPNTAPTIEKASTETQARLDTLKVETAVAPPPAPAPNAALIDHLKKRAETLDKRTALLEFRNDVDFLLESKGAKSATRREITTVVNLLKGNATNELPNAEEVAHKILDARKVAQAAKEISKGATDRSSQPTSEKKRSEDKDGLAALVAVASLGAKIQSTLEAPHGAPPSGQPAQASEPKPPVAEASAAQVKRTKTAMPTVEEAPAFVVRPDQSAAPTTGRASNTVPSGVPQEPAKVVSPGVNQIQIEISPKTSVLTAGSEPHSTSVASKHPENSLSSAKEGGLSTKTTFLWQDLYESAMKRISHETPSIVESTNSKHSATSPTQTISERQYRELLATERLLKGRLVELSKTTAITDTLESRQLKASLATVEQSKEYVADHVKVSSGKKATFDLLSDKLKLLERWEAQGNSVADLESFRAHHAKLGKSLGYDNDFIQNAAGSEKSSSPLHAEEVKHASDSVTAATKELSAIEAQVSKKWTDRLLSTAEKFKADLPGSDWAKQNPMKALTATIALSEAVSGALRADYSPNSKHSAIPTLVGLMSQDIATWGQFTTKDGGIIASVAAEATQKGLDAATVLGGFYALDKAVSNTVGRTGAGQAVGGRLFGVVGTRALGVAGVAYHGYSTFADGSFQNMTNTQTVGAVASPIVGGAAVGGVMAGPIGAGVGAGVGAVGEGVGIAVGYMRLESEINRDWKKREVRDSIKFARAGFVHRDAVIQSRKDIPLSVEATEVIEHQARAAVLSKILTDSDTTTIKALGFKSFDKGASESDRAGIAEHNWNRMTELTEGRGWYNPVRLYAGNPIDEVRSSSPRAAAEFSSAYAQAKNTLKDLYQRSMRVTYTNEAHKISADFEVDATASSFTKKVTSDMSPLEVLGALNQTFPGLPEILKHKHARDRLVTQLETHSGETGRFRRVLEIDQAAQGLVPTK